MSDGPKFFSPQNEAMLDRLLYNDFQRRIGGDLSEKQKERLVKTVRHYMNEVYEDQGEQPIPALNKEVLAAVVPDYLSYLRRGQIGSTAAEPSAEERTRMDVSSRYSQLQTERQEVRPTPPSAPDFRISTDDASSTALALFEQIKKQREDDALRIDATRMVGAKQDTANVYSEARTRGQESINQSVIADVQFGELTDSSRKRDELALVERNMMRQAASQKQVNLSLPPDPRAFFFGNSQGLASGMEGSGLAQTNPTMALPDSIRTRPSLPQDNIKKEDDIISYRENEYNLFLYSGDRNWVTNSTENRYNFSVNFDPANNRSGFGFSTAANIKFKNIVRIELVKVIVPTEGIDILAIQDVLAGSASGTDIKSYNTDINMNVLSFPYITLTIPELDTNNFGTNNTIDNAFGVVQYDGNWISDNTAKNRGYLAMIPKFMKCQKIYYPTPLATLQKLTIQLRQPNGEFISDTLDTLDVSGILPSSLISDVPSLAQNVVNAGFADTSGCYLWIQTKTWFNKFMVSQADRVVLQNVSFPSSYTSSQASTDFLSFVQRKKGHIVAGVGYSTVKSSVNTLISGGNEQGYCNYIIIRNYFNDPTTGNVSVGYFGGSSSSHGTFIDTLRSNVPMSGRCMNMNHQTQVALRVITRDLDSVSRLRPDNTF